MAEEKNIPEPEKVSVTIPQLFYDVIVRVIPGFVLLCGFFYTYPCSTLKGSCDSNLTIGYTLILGYVFSYLIGFLLGIASQRLFKKWPKIEYFGDYIDNISNYDYPSDVQDRVKNFIKNKYGDIKVKESSREKQFISVKFLLLDWIRTDFRVEGLRLQKLRAEERMLRSLMLVSAILSFVFLFNKHLLLTIMMILGFIISLEGYKWHHHILNASIINFVANL